MQDRPQAVQARYLPEEGQARLDEGKHKFTAIATDAAGNVDASAAKDKFKVVD